jgi:hypothetical protein
MLKKIKPSLSKEKRNFLYKTINKKGEKHTLLNFLLMVQSVRMLWLMQSQLLHFSHQRSSSLVVIGKRTKSPM